MTDNAWDKNKHLLHSWIVAYNHAILKEYGRQAKRIIDNASVFAVEEFTERLRNNNQIGEISGKNKETIHECIEHHISNLIAGDIWDAAHAPTLIDIDEKVISINVPVCNYREGCEWLRSQQQFDDVKNYPCLRIGNFIGAIRKYLKEEVVPEGENVEYFMTKIHQEDGCNGVIYIGEGFFRLQLFSKFFNQSEKGE